MSSLIKAINRSVKHLLYYYEKLTFAKLLFKREKNLKKCTTFEEQKGTSYIRGNVYFGIIVFSCLSSTKPCLRFLLICFAREIKGFHQRSLGNEIDFRDIMNVFPNILTKNQNFKKLRHGFVDERALTTKTLIFSCHWKTLYLFVCERKTWNAFLTLTVKYRKVAQKNKLCHLKQQ